jgi:hypothetical protein
VAFGKPNQWIIAFPLVMIPIFLVPLSILLQLASLHKLRQSEDREKPLGASDWAAPL